MTRRIPMEACLALLKRFDPDNATPQQTIATAATALEGLLVEKALADLNDGQFGALVDLLAWQGAAFFSGSTIRLWVNTGNFTLPPKTLDSFGPRGIAERKLWNMGNSL